MHRSLYHFIIITAAKVAATAAAATQEQQQQTSFSYKISKGENCSYEKTVIRSSASVKTGQVRPSQQERFLQFRVATKMRVVQ